ncbi:MAG: hypothetical protein POELPBGB_01922 [Bacteroidia bacterium]|nr:hypothetical protein [Bacteroidia bacterium]
MKKILSITLIAALLTSFSACKKDSPEGPNDLGGETDIELTQVGNVSSAYMKFGTMNLPSGEMTVTSNDNGIVTYHMFVDLTGSPDSAMLAGVIPDEYKDADGNVSTEFTFKITSEGVQDIFKRDRPWTIVKYDDGVGTTYPFTTDNGTELVRTITEKTGQDDWPMGFMYIKTTKVEQLLPPTDKTAEKITFRANHKFGLVYIELQLKNGGGTASIDIVPWFML